MFEELRRARADIAIMNQLFPSAERIAQHDGVDQPSAEHLLLAALDLDPDALEVQAKAHIDKDQLRAAIREQHDEALRSIGVTADDNAIDALVPDPPTRPTGVYRSTASAQVLFKRAVEIAKTTRSALHSTHFLLAATEPATGTLARAFDYLGADRAMLAALGRKHLG